ncbi:probable O-linked GlcNAc transferase-putative TPR-containing transmembrane protein [Candidatus Moduliflexus flocculans]|uniref:Probable O-linked GlcNAc transferase-putative TPR-containing transmembrane protein n=1 Tax=Candidatus Moduliflexus flocculans TaxID=1499966 RepID=A0A081BQS9_9BACT|nr:probable O-linked GlcNAc transferase-putative TPR-containing transmembrane protein [Candidatus Moduliflexus flocculans]
MLFSYQTARMLAVILFLFGGGSLFAYRQIATSQLRKRLFWFGIGGVLLSVMLTMAIHVWGIPRGLSAQYFPNATWTEDPSIELDRYFEPDGTGRRTDRYLDFNPNDFNNRYPFSGKTFTVKWEGFVYLPNAGTQISIDSNFDSWLFIDDTLTEFRMVTPQSLDIGTPAARPYLKKGWSFDERRKNQQLNFAWVVNDDAHFLLGVPEVADYELSFRCTPFSYPGSSPQQVSVFLDGTQIGDLLLKEGWETYTLPVPSAVIEKRGAGSVNVILHFSRLTKPSDVIAGSGDTRELAAAFDRVELRQISPSSASSIAESLPGKTFAPGIHKIVVRAKSNQSNPFIRLICQKANQPRPNLITEDDLFPTQMSQESLWDHLARERLLLKGLIVFESIILLLWLGVFADSMWMYMCQPQKWLSADHIAIAAICGFAFLIRLFFIFEMKKIDPNFLILPDGTDHLNYLFFARGFLRGYWPALTHEPFFQAPMISFYFIFCSWLFGEGMTKIRIMTALLSSLSVLFTFLIARRVFNRPIAYIAAILCACNGVLIFYDTSFLLEPLFIFFNLTALWLMLHYKTHLSLSTTIPVGILVGLTMLTRSTIVLLLPFLLGWMLLWHTRAIKKIAGHVLMIGLFALLVILPVSIRNYYSRPSHPFVLMNTNGGITFWIGNNASSTGVYAWSSQVEAETKARMKTDGTSYADEVLRFVKEQPLQYLQLEFRKLKYFWRGYEIGNNIPYYVFRQLSSILRLPWINFVLIGPFGLIGMILAFRRWREAFLLYGYVCVQLLATLLFFALARYRLPVVPVLSIFAAYTLWRCFESLRQKKWEIFIGIFCSFVVLYLVFHYPDAARFYEQHQGSPMPLSRLFRYWDVFYTW